MADGVETTRMSIDVYTGVSYHQDDGQGIAGSKIKTSGSAIGDIPSNTITITIRKVREDTTNQRLEVTVAREALEFIDAQSKSDGADYEIPLNIYAPSYVIDPFNKNWIEDKWRLSWSIKNADEWKKLWTLEHKLSNKGFHISWKPRPKRLSKGDDPLDDCKREPSQEPSDDEKHQFAEALENVLSVVSSSKSDSEKSAGTAGPDYFMSFESLVGTGQNQNGKDGNVKKTDAEKTYEDVLSSSIVRALQDKTQMISLDSSAQTRTRLTHSIEVSSIALRLAQNVKATLEVWQKDPDKDDSK